MQQQIQLPRECYVNPLGEQQIENEASEFYEFEGVDFTGEIYTLIKGAKFPYKGFPQPETLFAVNVVKSNFIESIRILSIRPYFFATLFVLTSIKSVDKMIEAFNRISMRILSPYILKDKHLSAMSRELQFSIFTFLIELGIQERNADRFSSLFIHLIEYDNAYRLRLCDLFGEVSQGELIRNPRKELKRMIAVIIDRDTESVSRKVNNILKIVSLGLFVPKFKRAFLKTVTVTRFENMGLDEADRYWSCMRTDYKFMGMTFEQRQAYARAHGWEFPKQTEIIK